LRARDDISRLFHRVDSAFAVSKRDYVRVNPIPDAPTALARIDQWMSKRNGSAAPGRGGAALQPRLQCRLLALFGHGAMSELSPLCARLCCKTLFGPLKTNFPDCGRGDRTIVRGGTTATSDKLTGNFGSALEDTSIGDYRLIALFAEKTLKAIFGVLQHYPPTNGHRRPARSGPFSATTGSPLRPSRLRRLGFLIG
jgi:hypothetical protein